MAVGSTRFTHVTQPARFGGGNAHLCTGSPIIWHPFGNLAPFPWPKAFLGSPLGASSPAISDGSTRLSTPRGQLADKIEDCTEDHADHYEVRTSNPTPGFRETGHVEGRVQQPKLRGDGEKGDAENRAENDGAK